MIIRELKDVAVEFLNDELVSGFHGQPSKLYGYSGHRAPGFHLSDVLQDLYIRLNKPKPRDPKETGPETLWTLGLAWETIIAWAWSQVFPLQPDRIIHLGEFELDGIIMTPDRLDIVDNCVIETKCTFKSAAKWPISEQWLWRVQGMAYCHALGMTMCRYYVLHVKDILGMYGGPPIPPKVWEVEWTQGELERNWNMVTAHRDNMLKGKRNDCSSK